jgi:hypothetical protein
MGINEDTFSEGIKSSTLIHTYLCISWLRKQVYTCVCVFTHTVIYCACLTNARNWATAPLAKMVQYTYIHTYIHTYFHSGKVLVTRPQPLPQKWCDTNKHTYIHTYTHIFSYRKSACDQATAPRAKMERYTYIHTYTHTYFHAGKVLVTRPQLLAQSVEQNLAPKIRTLLEVGGVPQVCYTPIYVCTYVYKCMDMYTHARAYTCGRM